MKRFYTLLLGMLCPLSAFPQLGQDSVLVLTLKEAIEIAREQSPEVLAARHSFRSQYWNYCYYKANYLPSLTLSLNPTFNHSISAIDLGDGTSVYAQQNRTMADATLSLSQNIPFTGGSLSLRSALQRMDMLHNKTHSYMTNPITIHYSQSVLGYNSFKWDRKIEPLRFEEAKKNYVVTLERVSENTSRRFFGLASAQNNLEMAKFNFVQADTLYIFAQGRYRIGTITENEILQLELNRLSEENNMLNAQVQVDDYMQSLSYYLGISEKTKIIVTVENEIPQFTVNADFALQLAFTNHPDILSITRAKIESESSVASAKARTGLRASLNAQFGLTQTNEDFKNAYRDPLNQQYVSVGITLPILDWGYGKGQVRMAESRRDLVYAQQEQNLSSFEQDVLNAVKQFNLQFGKVAISTKTDQIAERRNEIARKLYLLGESTILDLNSAIKEKDAAKRERIISLSTYWSLYYTLRRLTLYDFEKGIELTEDYQMLIK